MTSQTPFSNPWNYRLITLPIMLFVTIFIIWSALSEIEQSVKGEGRIIPSGQTKVLQHLEGGIIAEILVKEGESVDKGTPIFKLSQAFFQADQNEKKIELDALYARQARLNAHIEEKPRPLFSKELREQRPSIVHNEEKSFTSEHQAFLEELGSHEDKMAQKRLELTKTQARITNLDLELTIAVERVDIAGKLVQKGASSRNEYLKELALKQTLVTQLQTLSDSLPVLEKEIEEEKRLKHAFISGFKAQKLEELGKVQVQINKLLEKDKANVDRELRKLILSPVKGKVNKLHFHTIGGIIKPGDKVAEITPSGDSLMVLAQIKTHDRALIWEGQKVSVEITAFDYSRYGMLSGELIAISPDSFVDQQGNSYYEVKIQTTKSSFSQDEQILPGMIANVHIITGKKSILSYLIKPLKDISTRALKEY